MTRPKLRMDGWPTRQDVQFWTPAEHAIQAAIDAVERQGASVALTDAVNLLGKAKDRVADHEESAEGLHVETEAHTKDHESQLYPCPFCGARPWFTSPDAGAHCVQCPRCMTSSKLVYALKGDPTDELIEAWNNRAWRWSPLTPTGEEIAATLRDAHRAIDRLMGDTDPADDDDPNLLAAQRIVALLGHLGEPLDGAEGQDGAPSSIEKPL